MKPICIQIFMTILLLAALPLPAQDAQPVEAAEPETPAFTPVEADEIRGIRPITGETYWETNWPWLAPSIAGGVIVLVILTWLLIRLLNKPRQFTPREIALQQLGHARQIMADESPDADKRFSVTVSGALRGYLERALGLRAPEQTTEEFLQDAHRNPRLSEDAYNALGDFLRLCDLAKFARHAFGLEERRQLLDTARQFIEENEKNKRPPAESLPEVTPEMQALNAPAETTKS